MAAQANQTTTGTAPAIELRTVTKRFRTPSGGVYTALRDLDLTVAPGEFCAVVGPTGCGKSTTLSLVSGLERASRGETLIHGEPVTGIDRRVGFMFQTDAVFPWKPVLDNVAAGPQFRGVGKREAIEKARDWLRRVGLSGFEDRLPHQLSGGMRKRVALAQTLINEPEILLMDEPFSALDVQTRQIVQDELLSLWELTRPAVVFVTHDLEEAIALADKVVVLTVGPGTVKDTFAIDLPRPRKVQDIRFHPRFVELYEQIWTSLRDEVQLAYARTAGESPRPEQAPEPGSGPVRDHEPAVNEPRTNEATRTNDTIGQPR
ncbi:ABC transporter ATP-binding protein [Streptantibioticus ferralitis]|uniref:ABC transporter ATP-binding protein n=1 Tax=Streptantibioticus ferralitis TaxID=236510 RepID=A0ABT5Z5I0_9ACTN|nr:ABC transporter ATP-binding protein [Streptantibioticus ferralitis]MDF2259084.1 ABC transporter ATP-binding protein [Streptantibioticus ferralitis]